MKAEGEKNKSALVNAEANTSAVLTELWSLLSAMTPLARISAIEYLLEKLPNDELQQIQIPDTHIRYDSEPVIGEDPIYIFKELGLTINCKSHFMTLNIGEISFVIKLTHTESIFLNHLLMNQSQLCTKHELFLAANNYLASDPGSHQNVIPVYIGRLRSKLYKITDAIAGISGNESQINIPFIATVRSSNLRKNNVYYNNIFEGGYKLEFIPLIDYLKQKAAI